MGDILQQLIAGQQANQSQQVAQPARSPAQPQSTGTSNNSGMTGQGQLGGTSDPFTQLLMTLASSGMLGQLTGGGSPPGVNPMPMGQANGAMGMAQGPVGAQQALMPNNGMQNRQM